jgi:hypothetical protein
MEVKKSTYVALAFVLGGMLLTVALATQVVPNVLVTLTKAAPASKISIPESRVLGEKILAKADGIDKCVVNVFLMDADGKGVAGKKIELSGSKGIKVIKDTTDSDGKASFAVTSKEEGQFTLTASVGGSMLAKGVVVTFRN